MVVVVRWSFEWCSTVYAEKKNRSNDEESTSYVIAMNFSIILFSSCITMHQNH